MKAYFEKMRTPVMEKYQKEHDFVFVNHYGDPLTPAGVSYILDKIVEKAV